MFMDFSLVSTYRSYQINGTNAIKAFPGTKEHLKRKEERTKRSKFVKQHLIYSYLAQLVIIGSYVNRTDAICAFHALQRL